MIPSFTSLFFITLVVATITPGPSMLLALDHGIRFGARRALATALGNVCGTAIQCTISLAGLGLILARLGWVFTALRLAGAAYLIYLGLTLLLAEAPPPTETPRKTDHGLFTEALLVTLGNPKAIFFFSALFPQFMAGGTLGFGRACGMLCATLAVTFVCMMLYASAGQRIRGVLTRGRVWRWFNRATGATFVGLGVGLALDRK